LSAISAVVYREAKIRATNFTFIFWDLFFPLLYMLVFGVGINTALGAPTGLGNVNYNEFFLAGILAMASFAIASVFPRSRQRHLLRNAHLSHEPQ